MSTNYDCSDARNEIGGLLADLGCLVVESEHGCAANLAEVWLGAHAKGVEYDTGALKHHSIVVSLI